MSNQEIKDICDKYYIKNYTINDDGTVDVDDGVNLARRRFTEFPIRFGSVSGDFNANDNQLTTLEGSPHTVGGGFNVGGNKLTNLEGAPQSVGKYFYIMNNQLTSLVGCPQEIDGSFSCSNNSLTGLEGCPQIVGEYFSCSECKLTSCEGGPKSVGVNYYFQHNDLTNLDGLDTEIGANAKSMGDGGFFCSENPVGSIVPNIIKNDYIKWFKSLKIVKGDVVDLKRLKYLKSLFDFQIRIDRIEYHYKIKE